MRSKVVAIQNRKKKEKQERLKVSMGRGGSSEEDDSLCCAMGIPITYGLCMRSKVSETSMQSNVTIFTKVTAILLLHFLF